jgi:hypothetical protein
MLQQDLPIRADFRMDNRPNKRSTSVITVIRNSREPSPSYAPGSCAKSSCSTAPDTVYFIGVKVTLLTWSGSPFSHCCRCVCQRVLCVLIWSEHNAVVVILRKKGQQSEKDLQICIATYHPSKLMNKKTLIFVDSDWFACRYVR